MAQKTLQTYRHLLSELKAINSNRQAKADHLMSTYISSQYRKYRTTDETLCKAKEEMNFLSNTYLCYLQSLRKHAAIQGYYKGKGERSIEATANVVGFKLPHDPK